MATDQSFRNLTVRAKEYRDKARAELRKLMRTGQSTTAAGFQPQWGADGSKPNPGNVSEGNFGLQLRTGAEPNDFDVQKFIDFTGGNPYEQKAASYANGGGGGGVSVTNTVSREFNKRVKAGGDGSLLEKFKAELTGLSDKANVDNEAKFGRSDKMLGDLTTTRQALAEGLGTASKADIDERLKETLSDIKGQLATTGNANSNVGTAFELRAARDTANEQQRVAENVARLKLGMLAEDTNAHSGLIERKNVIGPNYTDYLPLLEKYGATNNGEGYDEYALNGGDEQRYEPAAQAPQVYGPGGGGVVWNGGQLGGTQRGYPQSAPQQLAPQAPPQQQGGYPTGGYDPAFDEPQGNPSAGWDRALEEEAAKLERIRRRQQAGYSKGDAAQANADYIRRNSPLPSTY